MKKISIDELVIEVTRRCNLRCKHCLRGPARNSNLDVRHFKALLRDIDTISSITFSGGEPTLAMGVLWDIYHALVESGVTVNSFYLATNGVNFPVSGFLEWCMSMNALCTSCSYDAEVNISRVSLSTDDYHIAERKRLGIDEEELKRKVSILGIADLRKNTRIIAEGRGRSIAGSVPIFEFGPFSDSITYYGWDTIGVDRVLYLTTDGFIVDGCDYSYNNEKKHRLCRSGELSGFINKLFAEKELYKMGLQE